MSPAPDEDRGSAVARFQEGYGFPLDRFQQQAVSALLRGASVLVAAPTGAGKTVVGEFACWYAIDRGGKCFYTTPIKALSNQKYRDLVERHGAANVGLLTGDRSINGEAPVVVMTTEVLRNMLYERSSTLVGLRYVVLDEVHYLADRERGAVWEEVLIQLSEAVQVAALSATVSNAEEFGDWLASVRDGCEVIIEERRPVPLRHHYFVNDRIYPTFTTGRRKSPTAEQQERAAQALAGVPNPEVVMLERRSGRGHRVSSKGRRVRAGPRLRWPARWQVVEELRSRGWLPAIVFVFSRAGCEGAVEELVRAGLKLASKQERRELDAIAEAVATDIPSRDLDVLGYSAWRQALLHGIAAHHAGLVPAFKEAVEVAFQRGLLKLVVATETLALGINMPARTVVIERLEKWDGEQHALLTPGEYTQLTGRAGRRGIDDIGHAVVLYQRDLDFPTVAGLVGTRTYPLRSSFEPSYNMAVNLLRYRSRADAETLLGASFAQFQADRAVAGTGKELARLDDAMRGYSQHLRCDRGDWTEYAALRRELSQREKREARERAATAGDAVRTGLASLLPGDVLALPWLPRRGLAAVVTLRETKRGDVLAQVVTEDRRLERVGTRELDAPPLIAGRVELPTHGNARQREYREVVASRLRSVEPPLEVQPPLPVQQGPSEEVEELRRRVRAHPCHDCPDRSDHERWQHRFDEVARDAERMRRDIQRRTGSLVRQFDRILHVLTDLGYVVDEQPTEVGTTLAGIYAEADLCIAESVRRGVLDGLGAAELAGVAAFFAYEPRGGEATPDPEIPTAGLSSALNEIEGLADHLRRRERQADLEPLRDLDAGFVAPAYRWANGAGLDDALGSLELSGGDFVRVTKQVADLVGQLRDVTTEETSTRARHAVDALRRGIVEA
ncbi:MAG: DEAD/DEAH box helicase [Actinobacteria bacterium]|nr:DEAD/DEAH box helicase [Actinomycetota bacterium]